MPDITLRKKWAMPNKKTFDIKPINEFIERHLTNGIWLDPFSNQSRFASRTVTNDLNQAFKCDYNLHAIDFLKLFSDCSVDGVLYDPPYSPRQVKECYDSIGLHVTQKDTQSSFWADIKFQISRVLKPDGKCISFGWNSGGIGKSLGFQQQEILLVAHGGMHNDTICVLEYKNLNLAKQLKLYNPKA